MKKLILLSLLSLPALALPQPPAVQDMNCKQAVNYAVQYKRYWKWSNQDLVPIFPAIQINELSCKGKARPAPMVERTLDNKQCIVAWYCYSP